MKNIEKLSYKKIFWITFVLLIPMLILGYICRLGLDALIFVLLLWCILSVSYLKYIKKNEEKILKRFRGKSPFFIFNAKVVCYTIIAMLIFGGFGYAANYYGRKLNSDALVEQYSNLDVDTQNYLKEWYEKYKEGEIDPAMFTPSSKVDDIDKFKEKNYGKLVEFAIPDEYIKYPILCNFIDTPFGFYSIGDILGLFLFSTIFFFIYIVLTRFLLWKNSLKVDELKIEI